MKYFQIQIAFVHFVGIRFADVTRDQFSRKRWQERGSWCPEDCMTTKGILVELTSAQRPSGFALVLSIDVF
jgi:hypothetical protein